jgi:hypothetical protein
MESGHHGHPGHPGHPGRCGGGTTDHAGWAYGALVSEDHDPVWPADAVTDSRIRCTDLGLAT